MISRALTRALARSMAALLGTMLLAGSVVLVGAAPAQACRCVQQDVAQQARAADLVVTGTVAGSRQGGQDAEQGVPRSRQQRRDAGRFGSVTLVVDVDRVYAGTPPDPTIEVTTAAATTACGLGRLPRGEEYVFFLTADSRTLRATSCNGTTPLTARTEAAVQRALGDGRALGGAQGPGDGGDDSGNGSGDAAPAAAELTVLDASAPPDAARTALPGGLLAVAGLVGLVVLGRVGSRRP